MSLELWLFLPLLGSLCMFCFKGSRGRFVLGAVCMGLILTWPWVSSFSIQAPFLETYGITWAFKANRYSFAFIMLACMLGFLCAFLKPISKDQDNRFVALILSALFCLNGLFLVSDIFLFFVFWELMIIPIYLMLFWFGRENRVFSSTQFMMWMLLGGLCLLCAVLLIGFLMKQQTGAWNFSYEAIIAQGNLIQQNPWITLLLLGSFWVKLGLFPFHTWKIEVFTAAPLPTLLLGVLIKTGLYGFLWFFPLFEDGFMQYQKPLMVLGVFSVFYGAIMAFAQQDMRRFLAYASVSHVGLMALGFLSLQQTGLYGAIWIMFTEALCVLGLFLILEDFRAQGAGFLRGKQRGLYAVAPRAGLFMLLFFMASLGLPGTSGFLGEMLSFYAAFQVDIFLSCCALFGVFLGACYVLYFLKSMFFGELLNPFSLKEISFKTQKLVLVLWLFLLVFGLCVEPAYLFG